MCGAVDSVRVANRAFGVGYKYRALSMRVRTTSSYSRTIASPYLQRVTSPYSKTCCAGSRIQRPALQAARYMCSPWRTQVRDHGFDRVLSAAEREIVSDAIEESSYIDLSYDAKFKSNTVNDTTKTSELPSTYGTLRSETSRQLFCEMSIEMHTRIVPTLVLMTTGPHRLRIQSRKRPTNSLRNIITLHDFGWFLHHRESTWYGFTYHRWRRMFPFTKPVVP